MKKTLGEDHPEPKSRGCHVHHVAPRRLGLCLAAPIRDGITDDRLDPIRTKLTERDVVLVLGPGTYEGDFDITGDNVTLFGTGWSERAVVIDGFISTSGALIAHILCPTVAEYLFAGHCSEEPGHRIMLNHLHLEPILDLGMRLGEGTGATLAMGIIDGAVKVFKDVLTFEEAGVANKED